MDQLPRSNEGFANNNLFADSQQYNAYDNLFQPGADQSSYDASWGINASNYPAPSRAQHASAPSWAQNANHLSTNPNGQAAPYARSLSHSPAPFGQNSFNGYGAQQNFQYRQPQYDPTLVPPHAFSQGFNYSTTNYQIPNAGTIAPHALENQTRSPSFGRNPYEGSDYPMGNTNQVRQNKSFVSETVNQKGLVAAIPNGNPGGYFSIINYDDLAKATKSERMGNFVNIGTDSRNWDCNRAALPNYVPRKSRNELRKIAGNDPKLLSKLGKTIVKKERTLVSAPRPLQASTSIAAPGSEKIKYDDDSSSEEESSSDEAEDSSYTSDDAVEPSPLPSKRPETPRAATEFDTTKALWRGKRRGISSDSIRKGLGDFWDIVKTIRDRWKADTTALNEAESKNRASELPLLKSRVKDQRDMMESAFKVALKHGHRDIIELCSENAALLYVCYQFLLDRTKAEDYNSVLPRAILETMTLFTTLTEDKLEKTHLDKVIPRFAKKGDAKTQFYAKRVISNAASTAKDKAVNSPVKANATKESSAPSPSSKPTRPEPVAGVKRPASATGDGGSLKKVAIGPTRTNNTLAAATQNGTVKNSMPTADITKPTTSTTSTPKQVVAKPSGLFSSLQSAAKKPGTSIASRAGQGGTTAAMPRPIEKTTITAPPSSAPVSTFSFAETMKNLSKPKEEQPAVIEQAKQAPQETTEEKASRLRKESRRHLHVSFKPKDELVQVRVFHHDPEEELGHDASQMRDVADRGGEGRMFKQQHREMDIDDDEEEATGEETKLIEFKQPSEIDFSDVGEDGRQRNYARFGGQYEVQSAERAVRDHYEANNLIVFYADASDIPPNPREPIDPNNGKPVTAVKKFAEPEAKWSARARRRNGGYTQHYSAAQQPPMPMATIPTNPIQGIDLSQLPSFANNQQYQQPSAFQPPQQSAPVANDALSNILATLKQASASQPTPPPLPMAGYTNPYQAMVPHTNAFPTQQPATQPNGQLDLAAILAQVTQNQSNTAQAPSMANFGYNALGSTPNITNYAPQPQQTAVYENPERRQWREGGNDNTMRNQRQHTGPNPYYKTKVCKYWQEGRCQKGDSCTYKHEES